MALFVKQDEERSQLQQKIAADMAERLRARDKLDETPPDHVKDSRFLEGTSHISRTGLIILIALVVVIAAVIIIVSIN